MTSQRELQTELFNFTNGGKRRKGAFLRIADIVDYSGIARTTLMRILRRMENAELVGHIGKNTGKWYHHKDVAKALVDYHCYDSRLD